MTKNVSYIALVIGVISLSICSYFLLNSNKKKIVYVRSTDLIYGYTGMQEAHKEYKQKTEIWQANIDTLQRGYLLAINRYRDDSLNLSEKEHIIRQRSLVRQEQSIYDYSNAINQKAKEEDDKITEGVLNQVNAFVEEYGKRKGYSIILGTTASGNILYGDEKMDITNEVLEELNKTYTGEIKTN